MNDIEHLIYKNYLVEQEMMDRLAVIKIKSSGVLTEATRVQLNEDVKDTVMTAIRKIMANIQEVWNKFKSTITSEVDLKRIAPYEKYFDTNYMMNVKGFPVPNMQEYDKMMGEKIPAFQESMVDELDGSGQFLTKYFNYFSSNDKEKTPKAVAEDKVFETSDKEEVAIGKEQIKQYVDFIKNYKKKADEIANDIKNLNNSSRSIENLLNQTVNETVDLLSTMKYYLEADDDKEKASFSSADPEDKKAEEEEKKDEESGEKKEKKPDLTKQINEYFRICNGILSTKLNITNKVRSNSSRIVVEFGKAQADKAKAGATSTEEKKPEAETNTNSGDSTVEI